MTHTEVANALMKRDGISLYEAECKVLDMQARIDTARRCGMLLVECEQVIADNLGLEPDYLEAFT